MSIADTVNPLAGLESGAYQLDAARTTVRMSAKANWGLQTVHATFQLIEGSLRVEADGSLAEVEAVFDAASFASGNARRDRHIASSDFLDAERFPTITFRNGSSRSASGTVILTGMLTVRGVTEPVDIEVQEAGMTGGAARFTAVCRLDRMRFGVSHLPRRVGKQISLTFDAVATRL